MSFRRGGRTPEQPTGPQKHHRFERCRLPMNASKVRRGCPALDIIDARKDGGRQGEDRPIVPRPANRELHYRREKQQKGDHLRCNGSQVKIRPFPQNQPKLQKGRDRETNPADQPQAKITTRLIAAKKKEQDQKNNEPCDLKEVDGEQALILQHYVPPPGYGLGARLETRCRVAP